MLHFGRWRVGSDEFDEPNSRKRVSVTRLDGSERHVHGENRDGEAVVGVKEGLGKLHGWD
ncbi:hypothetical protein Scep_013352 [Stephania cephalantha]|uniref:Uncharacterized protein n=1 Tax=Stephania cephalantha TaxID=152367 RepID=A0AAP0P8D7_9MAGN